MTRKGKIGRNDPCPCGSGKKYKRCCERKETKESWLLRYAWSFVIVAVLIGALGFAAAIMLRGGSVDSSPQQRVWSEEHGHWHGSGGGKPCP